MLYEQEKEFSVTEAMQNIQEVNNDKSKHFKDSTMELPHYYLTHLKDWEKRFWLFGQIRSLENEYRLDHFAFDFDEFCQFVNSMDLDFSAIKEDGTSHFDFSLYYDYRLIAKSHEISWKKRKSWEYLMDIPYEAFGSAQTFLETVVGQKEFPSLRDTVDQDLAKEKKIYTQENYERLMPDIEKMAKTKDYRFIHYCHDFIPEEDRDAFKALSDWVDQRDPHYFDDSIHEKGILVRSQVRIMETLYPKIHEFSLSDLNNSSKMYEYFNQNGITSSLFQRQLFHYCQDLYWERIEEIYADELEKLMQIYKQGINPLFSDSLVYPYECYLDILECAKKSMPKDIDKIEKVKTWFENSKKQKDEADVATTAMKDQLKSTKLSLMILSIFIHQYTSFYTMKEFYQYCSEQLNVSTDYVQKTFSAFLNDENEMNSELGVTVRTIKMFMEDRKDQKLSEMQQNRHQKRIQATLDKFGDEAVLMMRQFVNAEEDTITKFCTTFKVDRKEFEFLRKVCRKVDGETTELVDQKAAFAMKKFLAFMLKTVDEVSKEMQACMVENRPYDLLRHYEKYGYSPNFIQQLAKNLSNHQAARIIDQYMAKNPESFHFLRPNEIETMKRSSTGFYPSNLFLNGQVVKYKNNELIKALQFLDEKNIPVTKGTLFGVLNRLKAEVKEPVYQKRIKPKI